ncbi:MAG: TIGR02117 family protein [Rhizobacter sp.]|nr:TIGR02117 family protein [Ferruginibacter sp.]
MLFLVSFLLMYLLSAFCLSGITVEKEAAAGNDIAIYIKTNGVHTDIVVPVKNATYDWSKTVLFSNTHLADTTGIQWLAMGWGDKGFYLQTPTWNDLTFSTAFKAAFALSSTAIHATYYNSINETAACKKIMINTAQYQRLVDYLRRSYEENSSGNIVPVITTSNYGNNDAFYEGTGRYSMFKTCNSWANAALKSCGQKACLWTAFDTGIFLKYE